MDPNRVVIFDTTLRDGEQSPGISLNATEKLEIAHQLARLGVDVIEAGFPIASPGDFEAVRAIAREVRGPVIAGLARAHAADVERAAEAVRDAERPRIHTFISTSDIHIEHQLQSTREDVKGQARAAVAHARSFVADVEFSPMDATRADVEFTAEVRADRARRGRDDDQHPRHRRLRHAAGVRRPSSAGCTSWCRGCATSSCRCTATTTSGWRSRTRSPACRPARARSSARSTGSASARATRRSRRS